MNKFSEFESAFRPITWVWAASGTFWFHRSSLSKAVTDADRASSKYLRNLFGKVLVYRIVRDTIKIGSLLKQKQEEEAH